MILGFFVVLRGSVGDSSADWSRRIFPASPSDSILVEPPTLDDSPAQQRPKWVSAVKSPLRGGAAFLIAAGTAPPSPRCFDSAATVAVPETTPRSPWLVDPIREHCRRFWRINGLRRGTIDDVPLA